MNTSNDSDNHCSTASLRVVQLHVAQGDWTLCRHWNHSWAPGLHLLQGGDGAGKTSLLRVLAGEMAPRAGQVQCLPQEAAHQVFWVDPRQPQLADTDCALQWVEHLRRIYPAWCGNDWQQHVQHWALESMLTKPWHALSTGTARKIWMAAALASGAQRVLIDEPVAGLDRPSVAYLQQALAQHRAGHADPQQWVMVAHYDDLGFGGWDSVLALESLPQ